MLILLELMIVAKKLKMMFFFGILIEFWGTTNFNTLYNFRILNSRELVMDRHGRDKDKQRICWCWVYKWKVNWTSSSYFHWQANLTCRPVFPSNLQKLLDDNLSIHSLSGRFSYCILHLSSCILNISVKLGEKIGCTIWMKVQRWDKIKE